MYRRGPRVIATLSATSVTNLSLYGRECISVGRGYYESMWIWSHLAIAYLCYRAYCILVGREVTDSAVVVLALGALLADIIDKPLAWWFGILPNGRSLAHSLVITVPILTVIVLFLAASGRRPEAVALAIGHGTHLLADALRALVENGLSAVAFLAWPLLPPVSYHTPPTFKAHLATLAFTPSLIAGVILSVLTMVIWMADGMPGLPVGRALR